MVYKHNIVLKMWYVYAYAISVIIFFAVFAVNFKKQFDAKYIRHLHEDTYYYHKCIAKGWGLGLMIAIVWPFAIAYMYHTKQNKN